MRSGDLTPFGSEGGAVEVDETFIGNDRSIKPKGEKKGRGYAHKHKVLALVDRDTGQARSMVVDDLKAETLAPALRENLNHEARLMTEHGVVHHRRGEYGRRKTHTNTIKGDFSIFKRGMKGIYQHCGKQHLHRYLAEYDFRYNNRVKLGLYDHGRTRNALRGIAGRRLTYRGSSSAA